MTFSTPLSILNNRRHALAEAIQNGLVILPTTPEYMRNGRTAFPFRPDSHFFYLTGFSEPEAIGVWQITDGAIARSALFCRPHDKTQEIWFGPRFGPERAKTEFGFDDAWPIDEFSSRIAPFLSDQNTLYYPFYAPDQWDQKILSLLSSAEAKRRPGMIIPSNIQDLRPVLKTLRSVKDEHEIALMRQAAAISAQAHRYAMGMTQPGRYEYEIEAELLYRFRLSGAVGPAYPSIVASGPNACILHSVANDRQLQDNELILIDAACEWGWYASDITRTWPVNGKFQDAQRDLYSCVLAAQAAALDTLRPNVAADTPHQAAIRVLTQGLIDLGLLTNMTLDSAIETKAYFRFFMHKTSHWIGLDVHDVGPNIYTPNQSQSAPMLQPGQLLTIEPGLYVSAADDIPLAFHNIGIRIEDEVLITETGYDNLTAGAPKQINDIEALVGSLR